jgi:hypothetical protein
MKKLFIFLVCAAGTLVLMAQTTNVTFFRNWATTNSVPSIPTDVTNMTTNANGQLTVGPDVVTNINVGNVTFKHALTTGSGTGVDVFTVNGKIYQPYGGPAANGNIFNNGAWSDDGNGAISSAGLNTETFTSQTIQNTGNFNSDAGSFYSDGSGNVIVNTLTSEGAILTDSLSSGPSTFGTISSDIGAIHSDGSGHFTATSFTGSDLNITGTFTPVIGQTNIPIKTTGVTNYTAYYGYAMVTLTVGTYWESNSSGQPIYTNSTSGTMPLIIAPGGSINAASGISGFIMFP